MKYTKADGVLDVTDCKFESLEHFEAAIKGSRAPYTKIKMTKEQTDWYKEELTKGKALKVLGMTLKHNGKEIIEGLTAKDEADKQRVKEESVEADVEDNKETE